MSQKQINSRVSEEIKEAVGKLERDRGCASQSEAGRIALRTGLSELGYLSAGAGLTPARRIVRHVSVLLFYVAATMFAISFLTPATFHLEAIAVGAGSIASAAFDHIVLRAIEPAVTNRLPRLERRRGSAR